MSVQRRPETPIRITGVEPVVVAAAPIDVLA